jgi:hypothetical protein
LRNILFLLPLVFTQLLTAQQDVQEDRSQPEFQQRLEFQMYPNPFGGGKLYIVSGQVGVKDIMIINILGEVVFQNSTYEDYVLPNNLKSGIYIVKIKEGGRQGLSRLVVP